MALHSELPIFNSATKLVDVVMLTAINLRRDAKVLVGKRLLDDALAIKTLIRRANIAGDKAVALEALLEVNDTIEQTLRSALETRLIGPGRYGEAILLTQSIARQGMGWLKSSSKTPVARSPRWPGPSESQSGRAARPQGDRHAR